VRGVPNIVLYTLTDPARSCAIANAGIKGMDAMELAKSLLEKDKTFTVGVENASAGVHGVRVTPHVFIQPKELDRLVAALIGYARRASVGD
jgi:selenocysteine lyase/cysteine desulfurase